MPSSPEPGAPTRETVLAILQGATVDESLPAPAAAQQAVALARHLQSRAVALQTPQERRQQAELDRMIHHAGDKATMVQLTDQAFRSRAVGRVADQLIHILDAQGVPRFFSPLDRTLLRGFQSFGNYLPGVAVPLVKSKMQHETANVILPAEREMLSEHLAERRREGVRMNVNVLGEALLGEADAERRLKGYLELLQWPEIEVISVKISTIYSQISQLARRHTVSELCDRLELLYRAAGRERFYRDPDNERFSRDPDNERFSRDDGAQSPKFVYLDMEEYRDMRLTAAAFMQTLDRQHLEGVTAGIVLQAYIPDSFRVQQQINEWARRRVAVGGAPITLRIVKGANMEMERVEASLHGWPQAPFKEKSETDANFKRMLHEGLLPENIAAVRLGIASHNLFDQAYGLLLAVEQGALPFVQFEMLEGMANHQRRALFELIDNLLLYAPACKKEDFVHAIGYLVRRLDENTGPDNFLRHAFKLRVGSDDWNALEGDFLHSFELLDSLTGEPRRSQDRRRPVAFSEDASQTRWQAFQNEPDTDFSLPHNGEWAEKIVAAALARCGEQAVEIPLVVAGEEIREGREMRECRDPSRPGVVVGRFRQGTLGDAERAVAAARDDAGGWRKTNAAERRRILQRAAHEIRAARGELIAAAMIDGGKTIPESDPEVSEAVDFCKFYGLTAEYFAELAGLAAEPKGVAVVVSPWNFPIAIPCGGVAAALAAGNTVILKPASDTVLVAWELCRCFWRAGVSRQALQFLPCPGAGVASELVAHQDVDVVILTGGTSTAREMLAKKPAMRLLAETGGKNATIVTALSDRDQAIANVVHSAFGHSGQKCSATSLLILEEEVYRDESFQRALCDAVESIDVGPAHELHTRMGPLIRPPSGELERGLKELEPGESWAVLPHRRENNPHLYSPGVKWGVRPGSFTHMMELFGPVLGVMQAKNLDEAIEIVNQTGYGLTSGLESLDDREQELWKEGVRAGNLYINRGTTGAIVLRQPFGGLGKSSFGPGIKAGGPNYVAQLMNFRETARPQDGDPPATPHLADLARRLEELRRYQAGAQASASHAPSLRAGELADLDQIDDVLAAIKSYARWRREEFAAVHDHFHLIGQDNFRRYLPLARLTVRVHEDDSLFELFARVSAAATAGCLITVSYPHECPPHVTLLDELTESWGGAIEFLEESDEELAEAIRARQTDRVRCAPGRVPDSVRRAASDVELFIADAPVLRHGRIELLWYVQEQSICVNYHRYGNLGPRADEERAVTI